MLSFTQVLTPSYNCLEDILLHLSTSPIHTLRPVLPFLSQHLPQICNVYLPLCSLGLMLRNRSHSNYRVPSRWLAWGF